MTGLLLALAWSGFVPGTINRVRSILSGRKGPDLWQFFRDLRRLTRKSVVYGATTSAVFRMAPIVYLTSIVCALATLPVGGMPALLSFEGDFIFFAYVLALGKFFALGAAWDTGSPFAGMGSAREAFFSLLVEPAFFVMLGSFGLLTGQTSFYDIFRNVHLADSSASALVGILAAYLLFEIALVENGRVPFDDPSTHLELTMIHEAMILDYSGPDLALWQYAGALKITVFGALIAGFFVSPEWSPAPAVGVYMLVQIIFALVIGLNESLRARFAMRDNGKRIFARSALAVLIFFAVLLITHRLDG
jgi:formate hydrogenlyase subunit 4